MTPTFKMGIVMLALGALMIAGGIFLMAIDRPR